MPDVVTVITDEHRRNDILRATSWMLGGEGLLTLTNAEGKPVAVYAPGAWRSVFYQTAPTPEAVTR